MIEHGSDITVESGAYVTSRGDRDRTMAAIRELEGALARAAGAERWQIQVLQGLLHLEEAMSTEQAELDRPDSLLALIVAENSRRFGSRVRSFRGQYADIARQADSLRDEIQASDTGTLAVQDIRQRVRWIINALTHCRARQTDLVFEALSLDLGAH